MKLARTAFLRYYVSYSAGSLSSADVFDLTIGWRFINSKLRGAYGVDSMPETAENVAADFHVSRADQDAFAPRSQQRAAAAQRGILADEIVPVSVPQTKGVPLDVSRDEHPRGDLTAALRGQQIGLLFDGAFTSDGRLLCATKPHAGEGLLEAAG